MMLQIFIYINIFLAGAAIALAGWLAYTHFHGKKHAGQSGNAQEVAELSKAARERLLHEAEARFQLIIHRTAHDFERDLKATSETLGERLQTAGNYVTETEMKRYRETLERLRGQAEAGISEASATIAKRQATLQATMEQRLREMETEMVQDIAAEKQQLIEQMDKKLAGAVTAFLVETLGHNVDLGTQSKYLTDTLEQHKAELIKELE